MSVSDAVAPEHSWHRYGHLAVVYLVWGSTYLAVKICVSGPSALSPLQLQTWRMWMAGILLIGLSFFSGNLPSKIRIRDLPTCCVTGALMWVSGNGLATLASRHATSGFIVMAMGMIPVWTTLITSIMNRALPSRTMILGLFTGMIGLSFVIVPPALSSEVSSVAQGYAVSTALILCAAGLTWSLGSVLQQPLIGRLAPTTAAGIQMLSAALILTTIGKLQAAPLLPQFGLATNQIAAFLFLVVFGSAICLVSYIKVIKSFNPTIASTFAYVNPLVGVALGWALLGELPETAASLGMALILFGVFLVVARPSKRSAAYEGQSKLSRFSEENGK
ncbi:MULTISPECIES: DMT family transporter [Rhizobium]|uniref:Permease protein n=1 Tax=Rhizobium rhizogenes (strain K84 / ATCC BAA-868) TaxID=311403 RepID=B9JMP5_RHIR8|nr:MULTISPECIES: EamA family transporter [Rhizobium]ACM28826.1 permease protein [Rhizobium rhizogenes K84]EJK88125.1 putative permease, DMT superfamily [Rhizobium sp. AP16]NTI43818.1 EamA family transporter [Rhizobium rhizogenes]OCJ18913.1 permease [Agrobacterium sp. B131/95]